MAKKGQKLKKYDDYKFKEKVIKERLEQGIATTYLAKKYGIPVGTIYTWIYQYKHKNGKIMKEKKEKGSKLHYLNRYTHGLLFLVI